MLHNLRFAWRTLCTKPVFTAVAILSLALGIGANTAIFSVIESSLLRGLPYKDSGQLVEVNINLPQKSGVPLSPGEFVDYGKQSKALSGLAAFTQEPITLTGRSNAISLQAAIVSPNLFDVLGATAERGRLMSSKLDLPNTGARVAVLSDATWRSTFGADEGIVDHDITLNGKLFRVVGVLSAKQALPAGFQVWVNPGSWIPQPGDGGDAKHLSEAYDVPWLHGIARVKSGFTLSEAQAEANVVINQRFAEQYFPHQNPIGSRFVFPGPSYNEIIGVVGDVKYHSLEETSELDFYTYYAQSTQQSMSLLLRPKVNSRISVSDLRSVVKSLDPNIPLSEVQPLGDYLGRSLVARKFLLGLLTAFSVLAVFLAAIGLYAALAFSVQQRKQEIGIRVALGANSGNVLWLILRESLTITIVGTGIGLFGATWTASFLKSMLYGITDTDLTAYAVAIILALAVALAASLAPALRATRIDPLSALRYE